MGLAVMGTGTSQGENRAREAAMQAITSPLLENMSIEGAKGVLLNISGGINLGLHELSEAASIIYDKADEDATIILGSVIDETLSDEVIVTVIATGFCPHNERAEPIAHSVYVSPNITSQEVVEQKKDEPFIDEQSKIEDTSKNSSENKHSIIDTNDLDIPTFLRKYEMEKRESK